MKIARLSRKHIERHTDVRPLPEQDDQIRLIDDLARAGVLDTTIIDEVITVDDEDAYQTAKQIGVQEGLLVGLSAGANVYASIKVAGEMGESQTVVTILCDTGERYLSVREYFEG